MAIQLKTQIPGPKSVEWMNRRREHVARGPFHTTHIFAEKAHGAIIEDVDGNRLLDFASGIGVVNVGHCNETVVQHLDQQIHKLLHSSFNVVPYDLYVRVAEKLNQHTPGDFKKKTFLANSGAEAVENAIKIARVASGKTGVVCFDHAFHGRTYMAMTLTAKDKPYKEGFGPFPSDVYRTPYPYVYRWPTGLDVEKVSNECFTQFVKTCESVGAGKIGAVILEPVLGEGGFVPAPWQFLAKLREYCTQNKIILIADEIQTGFGRTGTLFACEQLCLVPDMIISAKGLAGGMPLSAITGRAEIMDAPGDGGIGGTFGGNPVACAAALGVFEVFEKTDLLIKSKNLGIVLQERLKSWQSKCNLIGDVRGLGPMQGMEFVKDLQSKEAYPEAAKFLSKYCLERGLIIMTAGTYGNIVRLLIPLTISDQELQEGLKILESGIEEVTRAKL